jgi:hypothetical protein
MPLNHITSVLQQIASFRLISGVNSGQLNHLFSETQKFGAQNLSEITTITNSLNQGQSIANTWQTSSSKQIIGFSSPSGFNQSSLSIVVNKLLGNLNTLSHDLDTSIPYVDSQIATINRLINEANSDEQQVKSNPLNILAPFEQIGNTLSSGTASLGNSIGHFFTHGSFTQVSSSTGQSAYFYRNVGRSISEIGDLINALNTLNGLYTQLNSIQLHMQNSVKDAQASSEQFLSSIPSLNSNTVAPLVNRLMSTLSNSLNPLGSLVNSAFNS